MPHKILSLPAWPKLHPVIRTVNDGPATRPAVLGICP